MLRQQVTPRIAAVIFLVAAYAVLLTMLITASRQATTLVNQTVVAERTLVQARSAAGNDIPALKTAVAAAKERVSALQARVPSDLQSGVFDQVAQNAQLSGILGFTYQRKNEFQESMQAGVYKVYRFAIAGRGTKEQVVTFLDSLQSGSGPTMLIENLTLNAAGSEWQMNADIIVYTTGG